MKIKKALLFTFLITASLLVSGCTINFGGGGSKTVDGGVWKSIDGGKIWNQKVAVPAIGGKTASIANVNVRRMIFDPQDYNTIYLSTEANGIIYTNNGGETWNQFKDFVKTKVRAVGVDPKDKCNLYALSANKMYKSGDCGRFWREAYFHQNAEVFLTDIEIDHHNSNIIYITTSAGEVLKSDNSGQTWKTVHRVNRGIFLDLAMDSRDSRIVYAATEKNGIFKTIDGGATWNDLGDGLKEYSGSHEYKSLVVDRATAGSLILVSKFGMLRSRDYGDTWEVIELLPSPKKTAIYSVAVNPNNSQEIYYATRTTLVKSIDGGASWSSQQLPFVRAANRIIISPENTETLYMGAINVD